MAMGVEGAKPNQKVTVLVMRAPRTLGPSHWLSLDGTVINTPESLTAIQHGHTGPHVRVRANLAKAPLVDPSRWDTTGTLRHTVHPGLQARVRW
jgi:hypothetical protein